MGADLTFLILIVGALLLLFSTQQSAKATYDGRIKRLERKIDFLFKELGVTYQPPEREQVSPEVIDLVHQGRKIEAIKLHRERTGVGLKEAKDVVDELERKYKEGTS